MTEPILAIHPVAQAMLYLAFALVLGAFAVWLVTRLRGSEVDDTQQAHDSLTKFRELHARGGLSDDEYRTIKTKLARELEPESPPPELGNSAGGE